ncbi:hypothetical protein [Thalassospira sp. UBA1131]|nr:hypothetical protein [Thalassospira sp. UBA1131]
MDRHFEQRSLVVIGREVARADRGYWVVPGASVNNTTTTLLDRLINET